MQTPRFALSAALACALVLPAAVHAQTTPTRLTSAEVKSLATVQAAILIVQDSLDKELAMQMNKKDENQVELRKKLRREVGAILTKNSLTDSAFQRRRFMVSSDLESRRMFDSTLAALTGSPLPGQAHGVANAPQTAVPATAAGKHMGHVLNSFGDTPDKAGLLPTAQAEARIAAQHAALAMRTPKDLAAFKMHAGHIINAIDPSIVTAGPGKQYGVKRAATGIATHIELAAAAKDATPTQIMHAKHVAVAARSTVARADDIVALAQKVQKAGDASEAANLMNQIALLCDQLLTGADSNNDGRVNWDAPEGGLQQVQEHVNLMLIEKKP